MINFALGFIFGLLVMFILLSLSFVVRDEHEIERRRRERERINAG